MKKIKLLFTLFLLITISIQAQVPPNAFNYSAVARDAAGEPIATTTIGIQVSILQSSTIGSSIYVENHFVNTDDFGLFNLIIGAGAAQTGTMENIAWDTDNFYLQIGMDSNGGTNFLTMGTTQLLSVPYALHASTADSLIGGGPSFSGDYNDLTNQPITVDSISANNETIYLSDGSTFSANSQGSNGGKTYIELFGDVTDAEADSILNADMGPNTQFIYVTNTSQLTTLDLDEVTGLIELIVNNNSMLQNVNVASLERCSRKIEFYANVALTDLNFSALTFTDDLQISDNNALSSLNLSSLSFSNNTYINNNIALNTISLSELSEVEYLNISNNAVSQITLDNISSLQLLQIFEPQLDNISLTNLTTVLIDINMYAGNLNSLDLPNLTSARQIGISDGSALMALNLPNLSSLQALDVGNINTVNDLDINIPNLDTLSLIGLEGNSVSTLNLNLPMITTLYMEAAECQINQLNLPSNVEIIDNLVISDCVLNDIVWATGITQVNYMELFFNSIPSTEINEILSWLISLDPSTFYNCITLSGNQPPAPPTGQGITDLNTLINNNVCIDVDSP